MRSLDQWWAALPDADRRTLARGARAVRPVDWAEVAQVLRTAPVVVSWPTGVPMFPPGLRDKVQGS